MKQLAVFLAGFAISVANLEAQSSAAGVPESHRPPPGMCRIWIDGVPPAHQPAPTDCATAIRKRPMNARVVFGSDAEAGSARAFAPTRSAPASVVAPASQPAREEEERAAQQAREQQERRAAQLREEQNRQREVHHDAPPVQHDNPPHAQPSRPRNDRPPRPAPPTFTSRRPR